MDKEKKEYMHVFRMIMQVIRMLRVESLHARIEYGSLRAKSQGRARSKHLRTNIQMKNINEKLKILMWEKK